MPRSTIMFRVPQDFTALQGPISDFPGECDRINYDDLDNLDRQLRDLIGEIIQIDFDEPHDPSEPVELLIEALKNTGAVYLASHEAYTEPSRGTRFDGRIYVSVDDVKGDKRFPWALGEPELAEPLSFRKAGFSEREILKIDQTFFTEHARAPKP